LSIFLFPRRFISHVPLYFPFCALFFILNTVFSFSSQTSFALNSVSISIAASRDKIEEQKRLAGSLLRRGLVIFLLV